MTAALQLIAGIAEKNYRLSFDWDSEIWGWGLYTAFKALGLVSLVIGPLHVNVDWDLW